MLPCAGLNGVYAAQVGMPPEVAVAPPVGVKSISIVSARTPVQTSKDDVHLLTAAFRPGAEPVF